MLIVTGGVVGAFTDVENSVSDVYWHQEFVCWDHKSAFLHAFGSPSTPPPPHTLPVIRTPSKLPCSLFGHLDWYCQWSEVIEFTAAVPILLIQSYVKPLSLPDRTCCWATRTDAGNEHVCVCVYVCSQSLWWNKYPSPLDKQSPVFCDSCTSLQKDLCCTWSGVSTDIISVIQYTITHALHCSIFKQLNWYLN